MSVEEIAEASLVARPSSIAFENGDIAALAVLPLENLSGDATQDYFADGMTEALITSLAKIKALRVISRTSAMQYKGAVKSLPLIARELKVDAVNRRLGAALRRESAHYCPTHSRPHRPAPLGGLPRASPKDPFTAGKLIPGFIRKPHSRLSLVKKFVHKVDIGNSRSSNL